jgi:hypothetical protein
VRPVFDGHVAPFVEPDYLAGNLHSEPVRFKACDSPYAASPLPRCLPEFLSS